MRNLLAGIAVGILVGMLLVACQVASDQPAEKEPKPIAEMVYADSNVKIIHICHGHRRLYIAEHFRGGIDIEWTDRKCQ